MTGLRFASLRPEGEESPGAHASLRWVWWSAVWVLAHLAGGAAVGALLGTLGSMLPPRAAEAGPYFLAGLVLIAALRELRIIRLPLPHAPRQIQRSWMTRLPWGVVAVGYGLQLGSGVATRIMLATTYVALTCSLLAGTAAAGALIMGVFGAARAILPIALGPRVATPEGSMSLAATLGTYTEAVGKINGLVLAAVWTLFMIRMVV